MMAFRSLASPGRAYRHKSIHPPIGRVGHEERAAREGQALSYHSFGTQNAVYGCIELFVILTVSIMLNCSNAAVADDMILVTGAGGTEEYAAMFAEWASQWKTAAREAEITCTEIGTNGENDYDLLKATIDAECNQEPNDSPLWLVLLGHGTFDRKLAKFNLRGKDVEAKELAAWLKPSKRPLIIINAFSCSGAFLEPLQAPNRVVITATQNGAELNLSRFGGYMAKALTDMSADLDHDDQVSLLEAFLLASSELKGFYDADARLMTEHALLEDNHDGKGISADFFTGIRAEGKAKGGASLDGRRAHRFILKSSPQAVRLNTDEAAERDRIETEIEQLRVQKKTLSADEYYQQLEALLLEMAELYDSKTSESSSASEEG